MDLTPTPKGLGSPTFTGESTMGYLSPCRRGLLPLKKRRKIVGAGAAAARANGHQTDDSSSSSSASNVIEPSPDFSSSKRSSKGAPVSSLGVLASAAAFASSSIISASSTSDAAAALTVQSDSSSAAMSAPSIPVLQGMVTASENSSSSPTSSSPTKKSRTGYQDRRFTDSDPPEARCQATTTRGRACAFVSIVGTKYCNVHAKYDTAPPPRRSGFGDGGGARVPASPRKAGSVVTSSSAPHTNEHKQTTTGVVQVPGTGSSRSLLNTLPSIQWSKKIVEIAVGPFVGEKGIVLKFGNGWVTVKVKGRDGKPLHHNRRSMELYLLPKDGVGSRSTGVSSREAGETWTSPKITAPSGTGEVSSSHDASATPLSPRSGREIHKPKRYDSSDEEERP